MRLHGRTQPLEVYQVLAETTARSRLEAAGRTGLTPSWAGSRKSGCYGSAGRRSRTAWGRWCCSAAKRALANRAWCRCCRTMSPLEAQAWLTPCQCSPYYQHTALYPMIELLERVVLRFEREESPQHKLSKLEGHLVQYGLPLAETVPLFAALLSLPLAAAMPPSRYLPSSRSSRPCTPS